MKIRAPSPKAIILIKSTQFSYELKGLIKTEFQKLPSPEFNENNYLWLKILFGEYWIALAANHKFVL